MTKKSIPVADNLSEYFTDPCPVLSDNNAQMILDEIRKGFDYVVEYGMGASTFYFLKGTQDHKTKFISVENNFDWFEICIREAKRQSGFQETSYTRRAWNLEEIRRFVNSRNHTADVPESLKRFSRWRDSISLGPFFRLSPLSQSRFAGKLGPLWPLARPLLALAAQVVYAIKPGKRPQNGEWRGLIRERERERELILRNVGPSIKDQFGEAPNMMDYIDAGLKDIRADLENGKTVTAAIIVDGGPRHKIVQEILSLEDKYKSFRPTIFLCDASRAFYHKTLALRPAGQFVAGSNKTFKGGAVANDVSGPDAVFWTDGDKTGGELAQQEVWFYQSH